MRQALGAEFGLAGNDTPTASEVRQLPKISEAMIKKIAELERDAGRYRFLRVDDNWGEDGGNDSWAILGESSGQDFDNIVDSRIAKPWD